MHQIQIQVANPYQILGISNIKKKKKKQVAKTPKQTNKNLFIYLF